MSLSKKNLLMQREVFWGIRCVFSACIICFDSAGNLRKYIPYYNIPFYTWGNRATENSTAIKTFQHPYGTHCYWICLITIFFKIKNCTRYTNGGPVNSSSLHPRKHCIISRKANCLFYFYDELFIHDLPNIFEMIKGFLIISSFNFIYEVKGLLSA